MSIQMLKGVHRRAIGISKDDQLMGPSGLVSGGDGKPAIVLPGPETVALWDDFLTGLEGTGQAVDTGAAGLHFLAKCRDEWGQKLLEARRPQCFIRREPADVRIENRVRVVGKVGMQGHYFFPPSLFTPTSSTSSFIC